MREIKFRAWWGNEMRDWDRIKENPMQMLEYATGIRFMQYTGLKDKNGVEIYESDRVKFQGGIGIINYLRGGFYIGGEDGWHLGRFHQDDIEVIGNIYED